MPRGPSRFSSGHAAVGERQRPGVRGVPAHLAIRLALLVAGRPVRHDEVGDLRRPSPRRHRGDHDEPEMSVPAFVMNCLAPLMTHAVLQRARGSACSGVRARLGLGQADAPSARPAQSSRHPLAASAPRSRKVDRLGAERRVGAERDRHGGVDARQLLDGEGVGERVAAGAAVLLGERDPHQARARRARARSRTGRHFVRSSSSATGATRSRRNRGRWSGSAVVSERSKCMCDSDRAL